MDFGFSGGASATGGATPTTTNQEPITNLNNPAEPVEPNGGNEPSTEPNNNSAEPAANGGGQTEFAIEPGTTIEFDGQTYTVDDNGNVVDSEGNIFKKVDEVKEWKDSLTEDTTTEENSASIESIQKAVGVDIVDENGNTVEFENTPDGIASYVNQVIENSKEETQRTAIESVFNKYPILSDVLSYYIANGNSLEGYGSTPDRSNIIIDEDNIEQQENIIKTAWEEQGRKGDVKGYIDYLKSNGTLLDVAKEELEGLQEADKEARQAQEEEAQRIEQENEENLRQYWEGVRNVINSKKLGKYQLPDTITRTIDGKRIGGSLEDFFNYVYRVDKEGKSAYSRDVEKSTPEERISDELLRAYLKYTGGSYENLIDMEINKKEVARLKLVSKQSKAKSVKFNTPTNKSNNNLDFGI